MEQLIEFVSRHPLLAIGFVAVLGLLIWTELVRKFKGVAELTPAQAVAWINDPRATVVDVSSSADFNKGHIVNARNIAMSRIANPDAEIEKLASKKVLLVCKTGQTALQAASSLKKIGIAEVAVLKGGMIQWQNDQYPLTRH